jgi:hypothetical protein
MNFRVCPWRMTEPAAEIPGDRVVTKAAGIRYLADGLDLIKRAALQETRCVVRPDSLNPTSTAGDSDHGR